MMSPSSTLANRSFLYGNGKACIENRQQATSTSASSSSPSSCLIAASDKIVYATLDSLALSRKPLPLSPVEIIEDDELLKNQRNDTGYAKRQERDVPIVKPKPKTSPQVPPKPTSLEIKVINLPAQPGPNNNNEDEIHALHQPAFDNESDSGSSVYNKSSSSNNSIYSSYVSPKYTHPSLRAKAQKDSKAGETKKERKEFTFARNVLHYVPMTSRRYYRKSRKLASKSLSLKSLSNNNGASKNSHKGRLDERTLKSRSLSRDELKYVTISQPSNFVHVASATKKSLMSDTSIEREVAENSVKRPHIRHEGKYADLRGTAADVYAEIGGANESFLWRRIPAKNEITTDLDYDDVGPPPEAHNSSSSGNVVDNKNQSQQQVIEDDGEQDAYDDVGPSLVTSSSRPASPESSPPEEQKEKEEEEEEADAEVDKPAFDEQVYDDVMPVHRSNSYDQIPLAVEKKDSPMAEKKEVEEEAKLELSLADEEAPEEDVYDDVGLPVQQSSSLESHERVNSLYAGSSLAGSIQMAYSSYYDKESEWEDEDAELYRLESGQKIGSEYLHSSSVSPGKKKLAGQAPQQRWSRKVRRQRSKASRKSSGRSVSRSRVKSSANKEGPTHADESLYVAVSLGSGTILLLGPAQPENETARSEGPLQNEEESKGLVQLRLLLEDDLQEASLYIAEDSSDDSNYETLQSYEPDDFSSDSEAEATPAAPVPHPALHLTLNEAPSRPIPPPPREASLLGHTLGRRMKMLRRSWIITKGSLGRMRRRASGDVESPTDAPANSHLVSNSASGASAGTAGAAAAAADNRKYFCSFKKHFRKSSSTGLSTFYLDKGFNSGGEKESVESEKGREEPIYTNGNWYREVGLYNGEESEPTKLEDQAAIDHYSVLAEEPLYQFYALDATRVAFESDSDGYEEVEELTPSSATTDLAKPGHRTLWCQTPQVINSGLLQSLTMEERKIQEAKFEILTSEASYLNSLRVLENEFASNQELVHEILTPAERDKLFGMVPDVLVASERFLAELESIWREDAMLLKLPDLLLKHGEKSCQVYVDYCSNQVSIDTTLKELRAKKGYKFLETVSRIEMRPACQSLSLHSFLMLPMQRITRLPLLADAVLSKLSVEHSERLSWEKVLTALSDVVGKCNEGARLAERRNEMDALARKLEYSPKVPPITLHDRELIRSGTVVHLSMKSDTEYKLTFGKKFHKTPLMLLLLTDYLLVTKLKSNSNEETFSVIETCKRSMVALESAPEDSPFAGRHAMVLTLLENHAGRQVEYVLTCENDTEKERWLDAVSPPKPTCVGETLYESWDCPQIMALHSYAPVQPDELALQPGDVINVLRKMNDGWLFGEKLLDGEQGWFPGNFTKEVASEHVRARNLRQRHRFLALSGSVLQRKAKQSLSLL